MIHIFSFKNKEKKVGEGRPQLGGQWKVPSLVALGMLHVWCPLEKKKKNIIFTSFHLYPIKFYFFFSHSF
jgi:hypothetical protein